VNLWLLDPKFLQNIYVVINKKGGLLGNWAKSPKKQSVGQGD